MRGVGEARGAVTVVNALPTGIGGAFGIDLRVRAEVTLARAPAAEYRPAVRPASSATPLVREAVREACHAFPTDGRAAIEIELTSDIPPERGLKSSSAVASAVILAIARAVGANPGPHAVAALSAQAGRAAGVSATGAFDDALAGLVPGLVVTDNTHDALVRSCPLAAELEVGLWIPAERHPSSPERIAAFRVERAASQRAVDAALAGDLPRAMELNSEVVERVMGYAGYADLRAEALRRGAIAAGTTGLGPALALVGSGASLRRALEVVPRSGGKVLTVSIPPPSAFALAGGL